VDVEKELAQKIQRLDILIIERRPGALTDAGPAALAGLPDGLERWLFTLLPRDCCDALSSAH